MSKTKTDTGYDELEEFVNPQWQEREIGMRRAEAGAGQAWNDETTELLRRYLEQHEYLFADHLWEVGLQHPTNSSRALGPIILKAARNGWIETVKGVDIPGFTTITSVMSPSNGQKKPIWKSLLYVDDGVDWDELLGGKSDYVPNQSEKAK